MGSPYAGNATTFLVHTVFGLYILIVMLRFLFQLVRADFYNPLSQFIVRATNPPLVYLRRFIPGVWGIDLSAVALMVALQLIELWIIFAVRGADAQLAGLLVLALAELLNLTLNVFFFSILIQVILSWVNPGAHTPVTSLLHSLNEPLLGPARRLLPPFSGLDLSPLLALIALKLAEFLVVDPVRGVAATLL
jgi:YggT family protein